MLMTVLTMSLALTAPPQAANSSCGWENGRWVCRDVRPPAPVNPMDGVRQGQQFVDDLFRQRQAAQPPAYNPPPPVYEDDPAVRQAVGRLILAGECREAISTALRAGQIKLAVDARDFCEPAARPTEPTP